ncbi:hypothetical protein BD770DRAFT_400350 [Pilaira anomala]|nr:hypothetical protein BD770DRAFT_400350 [Pilaira anomala]
MVFIKSFILSAVFLFFQGVQSYCIHNRLTNGSFTVVQEFTTTLVARYIFLCNNLASERLNVTHL